MIVTPESCGWPDKLQFQMEWERGVDPQLSTEGRGGSDGTGTAEAAVTCFVFGEWSCLPYAILQILKRSLSLTP